MARPTVLAMLQGTIDDYRKHLGDDVLPDAGPLLLKMQTDGKPLSEMVEMLDVVFDQKVSRSGVAHVLKQLKSLDTEVAA